MMIFLTMMVGSVHGSTNSNTPLGPLTGILPQDLISLHLATLDLWTTDIDDWSPRDHQRYVERLYFTSAPLSNLPYVSEAETATPDVSPPPSDDWRTRDYVENNPRFVKYQSWEFQEERLRFTSAPLSNLPYVSETGYTTPDVSPPPSDDWRTRDYVENNPRFVKYQSWEF